MRVRRISLATSTLIVLGAAAFALVRVSAVDSGIEGTFVSGGYEKGGAVGVFAPTTQPTDGKISVYPATPEGISASPILSDVAVQDGRFRLHMRPGRYILTGTLNDLRRLGLWYADYQSEVIQVRPHVFTHVDARVVGYIP